MADNASYLNEYNGGALVGTAASFLVLTYVSVALRTYVRTVMTSSFQADDWLMLVSLASFTISCIFILVGVHYGVGRHNSALPQGKDIEGLKWQALATANYILNTLFVKLSIGVFLLRLSVQKRYTYTLWATMAIVTIWSLVLFFWDIFQCSPVRAQWNYTIPDSRCVSAQSIVNAAYALSVMTICSDWLFALLPIPMIWKVKMTMQTKMSVVVILGLGVFASVATLIRLKFLSDLTDTSDILFAGTDAMVWTLIEPGLAISAASFVVLRPLLRAWRVRGFDSTENTGGGGGGGGGGYARSGGTRRSWRGPPAGVMPGFGPTDVTLVDMEAGGGGGGPRAYRADAGAGAADALKGRGGGKPAAAAAAAVLDASFPSQATTLASKASRTSGSEDDAAPAPAPDGSRSPDPPESAKSDDVFIIEGPPAAAAAHPHRHHYHHHRPEPPARRLSQQRLARLDRPPSVASDEELDGLEAQSQHSGKVGLGGRG